MNRLTLVAATVLTVLFAANTASAAPGIAPLSVQDDLLIQAKHGHGHHGHKHHGHGHHYGWHRGRGHHYGWYRGRGHHRHHHWH